MTFITIDGLYLDTLLYWQNGRLFTINGINGVSVSIVVVTLIHIT